MFPVEAKKGKKGRKSAAAAGEDKGKEKELPEPVDVLVDTVIGFLEKGTAYMRAVANQAFALLAGTAQASTIDLILTVSTVTAFFLRLRVRDERVCPLLICISFDASY